MAYASLAEVRAEGLTEADAADARVATLLDEQSAIIDELTGQTFTRTTGTRRVFGRGAALLWLPLQVASVTEIREISKSTGAETALTAGTFYVYDRPSDAANPKIERLSGVWTDGTPYDIDGDWGRVGADGETPTDIKRATIMLTIHWAGGILDPDAIAHRRQVDLRSVSTRGRSETYGGQSVESTLTGVPDVDRILARYRAPLEVW